ncbi:MAG: helicase-associated domain-containing protein [Thermoplasmataceae archaeon]
MFADQKPLIVQGDGTIFFEVDKDPDHLCRDRLLRFSELIKSPEHVHTYKITPLAIWNAASSGITLEEIMDVLLQYSKYSIPSNVEINIRDWYSRYGKIKLVRDPEKLEETEHVEKIPDSIYLVSGDSVVIQELLSRKSVAQYVTSRISPSCIELRSIYRGRLKQALIKVGYPVEDRVGYLPGDPMDFDLRKVTLKGEELSIRPYQKEAVESFVHGSKSGIIVLPSGSGKTVVGMTVMNRIRENTLIITTGTVAVRQWISELLDKTSLSPGMIGEYTGDNKEILPVTVTTYQTLTYSPRKKNSDEETQETDNVIPDNFSDEPSVNLDRYPHLDIFRSRNWGIIIYDEVHLLPAPVFRITTEIQAKKRLGLTATLIREDGKEEDAFSLIGPKKYDAPWKDLEKQGWIATAFCHEVRVKFPNDEYKMQYAVAPPRIKYRIAAENPMKLEALKSILYRLSGDDSVLIIGDYIEQLEIIASDLKAPLITGKMKNSLREKLYADFRSGSVKLLVVSKVANYAIDLPDANVAIQVSGTFGSRQEEAQRLGRLLRPKSSGTSANFYSIVTRDTVDQDFSMRRQMFLTERGYKYDIMDHSELLRDIQSVEEDE